MAKPKETPLFEEPEFDEKDYLSMEKERAKGILVIFVIGALSGVLAGYLQLLGYAYLSVLLMLGILLLLTRLLTVLGIKVSKRTSHQVINYGTYVLTWLLFWIIFLNPPIHVVSSPQIESFQYQTTSGWSPVTLGTNDVYQGVVGAQHYSIHLTYKYVFNVTGLAYVQQGSPTSIPVSYQFSNGYLNYSLSSSVVSVGHVYDFSISWSSEANLSVAQQPLTFTVSYS